MKYFLFDIGNVLVDFDTERLLDEMTRSSGRPHTVMTERDLFMIDAVEKGHLSDAEYVGYLNEAKGLAWDVAELVSVWARMFTVNETGCGLFEQAKRSDTVSVHTLSNIAKHHVDAIESNWNGFFDGADRLFFSYQIGARKPDPAIYRHVLDQLGVPGGECFFIDDRPENIEAARDEGIEAHLFIPGNHAAVKSAAAGFFGW